MNDTIDLDSDTIPKNCLMCGKLFRAKTDRAKYCSEACKQQSKRVRSLDPDTIGEPKTDVDKEFEEHKPNYYKYGDTIRTVKCMVCGKDFQTSLNLLKTCNIAHQQELLLNLTGVRVKK